MDFFIVFYFDTGSYHVAQGGFELVILLLISGNTLMGCGKFLQKVTCILNQCPKYCAVALISKIPGSRNQGLEMGVALLLPAQFLLFSPCVYVLMAQKFLLQWEEFFH
jgi:hypothetical protein